MTQGRAPGRPPRLKARRALAASLVGAPARPVGGSPSKHGQTCPLRCLAGSPRRSINAIRGRPGPQRPHGGPALAAAASRRRQAPPRSAASQVALRVDAGGTAPARTAGFASRARRARRRARRSKPLGLRPRHEPREILFKPSAAGCASSGEPPASSCPPSSRTCRSAMCQPATARPQAVRSPRDAAQAPAWISEARYASRLAALAALAPAARAREAPPSSAPSRHPRAARRGRRARPSTVANLEMVRNAGRRTRSAALRRGNHTLRRGAGGRRQAASSSSLDVPRDDQRSGATPCRRSCARPAASRTCAAPTPAHLRPCCLRHAASVRSAARARARELPRSRPSSQPPVLRARRSSAALASSASAEEEDVRGEYGTRPPRRAAARATAGGAASAGRRVGRRGRRPRRRRALMTTMAAAAAAAPRVLRSTARADPRQPVRRARREGAAVRVDGGTCARRRPAGRVLECRHRGPLRRQRPSSAPRGTRRALARVGDLEALLGGYADELGVAHEGPMPPRRHRPRRATRTAPRRAESMATSERPPAGGGGPRARRGPRAHKRAAVSTRFFRLSSAPSSS